MILSCHRFHRSMDRTLPSEGRDAGSIPAESTIRKEPRPLGARLFSYFAFAFAMESARRDFLRAAVFALITPLFFALSMAAYAAGSSFRAAATSLAVSDLVSDLEISRIASLRRKLNTCFFSEERIAFLAELVIAICVLTLMYTAHKCNSGRINA